MEVKVFEIRDRATFIPIIAVSIEPRDDQEGWLLREAGYMSDNYVTLVQINGGEGKAKCIPEEWGDRTYAVAHRYIWENFHALSSGSVIDVEFILGETKTEKESDRWQTY